MYRDPLCLQHQQRAAGGVTAPPNFSLDHWYEVHSLLADLATLARNTLDFSSRDGVEAVIEPDVP
jgi:hypothetical protein